MSDPTVYNGVTCRLLYDCSSKVRDYSTPLSARSTDRRDFFATTCALLENLSCNPSTGFGIGQCMVVIFEMKPAAFGHCVELMIR